MLRSSRPVPTGIHQQGIFFWFNRWSELLDSFPQSLLLTLYLFLELFARRMLRAHRVEAITKRFETPYDLAHLCIFFQFDGQPLLDRDWWLLRDDPARKEDRNAKQTSPGPHGPIPEFEFSQTFFSRFSRTRIPMKTNKPARKQERTNRGVTFFVEINTFPNSTARP